MKKKFTTKFTDYFIFLLDFIIEYLYLDGKVEKFTLLMDFESIEFDALPMNV